MERSEVPLVCAGDGKKVYKIEIKPSLIKVILGQSVIIIDCESKPSSKSKIHLFNFISVAQSPTEPYT